MSRFAKGRSLFFIEVFCIVPLVVLSGCSLLGILQGDPEMHISYNGQTLSSENPTIDLGAREVGTTGAAAVISIDNSGDAVLALESVVLSDPNHYSLIGNAATRVQPREQTTVSFVFHPREVGAFDATITIVSNDSVAGRFVIDLTGRGIAVPVPDISLRHGTEPYEGSSASYDFGSRQIDTSGDPVVFSIENSGAAALVLESIALSEPTHFTLTKPDTMSVQPGDAMSFSVVFHPRSIGEHEATIEIASNDPDDDSYVLGVTGIGSAVAVPIISIRQNSEVYDGESSSYDFGTREIGDPSVPVEFTIENIGDAALVLGGVTLSDATHYALIGPPGMQVEPGGSTSFTISFEPQTANTHDATVTITSNDADRGTFIVTITGDGALSSTPELSLWYSNTPWENGSTHGLGTRFVYLCMSSISYQFLTIRNSGTAELRVSDIALSGEGPIEVELSSSFPLLLAPGASSQFSLKLPTSSAGVYDQLLTISSNDPSDGEYTVYVPVEVQQGPEPEMEVSVATTVYATGESYDFGEATTDRDSIDAVLTISNTGERDLYLSEVGLAPTSDFSIDAEPTSPVPAGGSTTLIVSYHPTSLGDAGTRLEITTNECGVGYSLDLTGRGVSANDDATIHSSSIGRVSSDGTSTETITLIPAGTTVAQLRDAIVVADGASFAIYQSDGSTLAADLRSGYRVVVTAGDNVTTVVYIISVLEAGVVFSVTENDYTLKVNAAANLCLLTIDAAAYQQWLTEMTRDAAIELTNILYTYFQDDFDFVVFINDEQVASTPYSGRHKLVGIDFTGTGDRPGYNVSDLHGSAGELNSVIHLPKVNSLRLGPMLHEIEHLWGAYFPELADSHYSSHWGYSNAGGQLGGWEAGTLTDLGDGVYQAQGPLGRSYFYPIANGGNSVPYSELELYLMGLIDASEVQHTIRVARDAVPLSYTLGKFAASSIDTYTIDDIIATTGPRVPGVATSQKQFRALVVLISDGEIVQADWAGLESDVTWFSMPASDGNPGLYNFWEATGGRATMQMGNLAASLKPEYVP